MLMVGNEWELTMTQTRLAPIIIALLLAPTASAAELASVAQRALDLSPERVAAFKQTLREFGTHLTLEGAQAQGLDLQLSDAYQAVHHLESEIGTLPAGDWGTALPVGLTGRDLVFEETFLMEGREDDFEDAAKRWLSRSIKGSDAARAERGSRFAPKFGWSDGPVVGIRRGPFSVNVEEDGWNLRWSHRLARHPGWVARVSAGMEDDEPRIAFKIGRSLVKASHRAPSPR